MWVVKTNTYVGSLRVRYADKTALKAIANLFIFTIERLFGTSVTKFVVALPFCPPRTDIHTIT